MNSAEIMGFDMQTSDGSDKHMADWFNTYMTPYLKN